MFGVTSTPSSSSRSSSTVASSSSRWKTSVSLLSMPVTADIFRCKFSLSDAQLSRQRGSSSESNLSNKSLQCSEDKNERKGDRYNSMKIVSLKVIVKGLQKLFKPEAGENNLRMLSGRGMGMKSGAPEAKKYVNQASMR